MLEQHALWLWFVGFTSALLIGDYVYTKKHLHKDFTLKEVVGLNILWMVFAAIFLGGAMLISASYHGYQLTSGIQENAVLWLTGFVVEKSLAMVDIHPCLKAQDSYLVLGRSLPRCWQRAMSDPRSVDRFLIA